MRLIDANALKQKILEERNKIPLTVPAAYYEIVREKDNQHGNAMRGGIRIALRCMENTPTIEAEPVRHGKWMKHDLGETYCSKCHSRIPFIHRFDAYPDCCMDYEDMQWDEEIDRTPYCPRCGAKMDLEG